MESDILVVDDSAAIRKILQRVLRQTGMAIRRIYEAGDGEEALELLKMQKIHLVLLDINMPRMGGLQLLAFMKASTEWRNFGCGSSRKQSCSKCRSLRLLGRKSISSRT